MTTIKQTKEINQKSLAQFQASLEKSADNLRKAQANFIKAKEALDIAQNEHTVARVELSKELDNVWKACEVRPLGA